MAKHRHHHRYSSSDQSSSLYSSASSTSEETTSYTETSSSSHRRHHHKHHHHHHKHPHQSEDRASHRSSHYKSYKADIRSRGADKHFPHSATTEDFDAYSHSRRSEVPQLHPGQSLPTMGLSMGNLDEETPAEVLNMIDWAPPLLINRPVNKVWTKKKNAAWCCA